MIAAIATPLLFAATAAVTLFAMNRWVTPIARWTALVLSLLPLVFTGEAMLRGAVYAPANLVYATEPLHGLEAQYGLPPPRGILTDVSSQMIPWRKAVRFALSHGEWPLWNPFMLSGDPLAGCAQPAPFYPLNLLGLLLPLGLSLTFYAAAQILWNAFAAWLFARELGCGEAAATLGAVVWAFSSFAFAWHQWPLGATLGLAPFVLLGVRRLARDPRARNAGLLLVGLVLVILAGHPESLAHVVFVGAIWGAAELVRQPRSKRFKAIALAAATGLAALIVTAPYLLQFVEVLPQTQAWSLRRSTQEAMHRGQSLAEAAIKTLRQVAPAGTGERWFGPALPLESADVGTVAWALILFGLWRGKGSARWLLLGLGLLGLLVGARWPLLTEGMRYVPLLSMSLTDRFTWLAALALALLTAIGTEAWLGVVETSRRRLAHLALLASALAAAMVAGVVTRYPPGVPHDSEVWAWALWGLTPPLLLAFGLLVAGNMRFAGSRVLVLVFALIVAQRWGELRNFYPVVPRQAFYPRVPIFDLLPKTTEPYRLAATHYGLIPNASALWEIEDPRGYQATTNLRYGQLADLWSTPQAAWFNRIDWPTPILDLLNVRFLLGRRPNVLKGWKLVGRDGDVRLWENPRVLSRAFLPRRVRFVRPGEALAAMATATDFAELAWIEAPPELRPAGRDEVKNAPGWVRVERHGTGLVLITRLHRAGWVVVTNTAWKGWKATSNGERLPIAIADHAFLAIRVPEGKRIVNLWFGW